MDLRSRVLRYVRARKLIKDGDDVLVGVSGGVDSFVLFDILNSTFKVHAAHFDHRMRPHSQEDASRVKKILATRYHCAVHLGAAEPGVLRSENTARIARYHFLDDTMRNNGCAVVALAHHADD